MLLQRGKNVHAAHAIGLSLAWTLGNTPIVARYLFQLVQ